MRKNHENCQIDGRKQERTFGGSASEKPEPLRTVRSAVAEIIETR